VFFIGVLPRSTSTNLSKWRHRSATEGGRFNLNRSAVHIAPRNSSQAVNRRIRATGALTAPHRAVFLRATGAMNKMGSAHYNNCYYHQHRLRATPLQIWFAHRNGGYREASAFFTRLLRPFSGAMQTIFAQQARDEACVQPTGL